jgi:hypothetical protein
MRGSCLELACLCVCMYILDICTYIYI